MRHRAGDTLIAVLMGDRLINPLARAADCAYISAVNASGDIKNNRRLAALAT
jgi:hypothetical protein